jgi:RNA polymerase sigma-70 factor (family 1)
MPDYKSLLDNDLLQLLKESDHSAYNEIYRRYFYLTYTHAYKKLRDEEQAKDVVQDVFTSLWFKRETNLPNSSLGGYLYTAVRYKIFDLFAHQEVESKYVDSVKDYLSTHSSAPTDHLIREKQLQAYIEKEINALPPKMKQIFLLSRKENLSHQEIAQQLDISTNNVSKQVNNALRILRTKLGIVVYIYFLLRF